MADKKDTIGGLSDAVETLNKDNASSGIEGNQILGNIESGIQDLYAVNSQMLEAMSAIQASLAPDAFGSAQSTETEREEGTPIVGGPAEQSTVQAPGGEQKKGFGMLALAGAAVAGGVAGIIAGLAGLLDFDAEKVKQKVVTLLSIKDEVADGSLLKMLGEAGTFALAMAGIGAGLAAFGVGAAVGGGGLAFADWVGGEDWAQSIKDSVVTLLSIKDELGGNIDMLMDSGTFALAMAGVGLGLAAFGAGAFVGGGGLGFAEWAGGDDWSEKIKEHVVTLLSIKDELGGNLDMLADGGAFMLTMTGIGLGLAAFGIGSAAAGLGEAVAKFSSGENWSENVVEHVKTLSSVTDEVDEAKAEQFSSTMGKMAAGLLKFSGGNFLSSIMDAGASLMNFLSGNESPIEQMITIADKSAELNQGADAIDRVRLALGKLSEISFDGAGFNIKDLTDDLMNSIPALELAIQGGTVGEGFFSSGTEIKGLASPDIDYEAAVARINSLREALGGASASVSSDVQSTQPVAQTAVPADTGASITGSTDTTIVDTGDLTLPYNSREKKLRAKQLAKALGMGTASTATFEAGIPTTVDGVEVPTYLYTNDEIDRINGARTMRASMNNTDANLIPARQSGEDLRTAQAEANANSGTSESPTIIQSNVSPNTVNNQSTTNVASRTQHHTAAKNELMLGAF